MKPIFVTASILVASSVAWYGLHQAEKPMTLVSPALSQPMESILEADKQAALAALFAHVEPHYCDAEAGSSLSEEPKEDVFVWSHQGKRFYLVWWHAATTREVVSHGDGSSEEMCSGGSGSSSFYLAKLIKQGQHFMVQEQDILNKINATNYPKGVDYLTQPKAIHPRFIERIQLNANHTLSIIADKHASEIEAHNFPSQRWQYQVRLSDMKVLRAKRLGVIHYQDDGSITIQP